jgi:hypothetical protein
LDENSISNTKNLVPKRPEGGYDLLFDGFSLRPNESITIKYFGTLKKIKYLELQVGLFEKDEP